MPVVAGLRRKPENKSTTLSETMKKPLLLLLAFFTFQAGYAQQESSLETKEMETDRPSVGDAAKVVPKGALQFEVGLKYENDETNFTSDKEFELPQALVRYGVLDFLELRLRAQVTHQVHDITARTIGDNRTTDTGADKIMLGTKVQLYKKEGSRTAIALQADFQLPIGDATLQPENVQPKLRLNFRHDLSKALSLNYNLGVEWEENVNPATLEEYKKFGLYTLGLQYKITNSFGVFAEAFGELHQNDMQQSFDVGLGYKVKPNLQFDLYAGAAASEEAPDYFVSGGVSFRLPK